MNKNEWTITVWVQKSHPCGLWFSDIFWQTAENFKSIFTHLLYVLIYARLHIFIQLSQTLPKLCHIKLSASSRNTTYAQNVNHRPKPTRSAVCESRWYFCWSLFVASHPRSAAFKMSTNMLDMTWRQQWRHLLSKQTYKLSCSEMSKIRWVVSLSMA